MQIAMTEPALSVPAEWAPQRAIWTAWPADPGQWNGDLAAPRADIAGLVRALSAANRV
jgi:agmatine deiminase